jgi:hypothetical protein
MPWISVYETFKRQATAQKVAQKSVGASPLNPYSAQAPRWLSVDMMILR